MKRNGFFSFLAALCFLIPAAVLALQIRTILWISPRAGVLRGMLPQALRAVCLLLMAVRLFFNRPLRTGFALLPAVYFFLQLFGMISSGGQGQGNPAAVILNLCAWLMMVISCVIAAKSRSELPPAAKSVLFLPAVLSLWGTVMTNGVDGYLRLFRAFNPENIMSWVRLAPVALGFGFLFFGLWAASGVAVSPGAAAAPAAKTAIPSSQTGTEDRIIRQYKGFLESGIITQAEFDAKMRSLRRK